MYKIRVLNKSPSGYFTNFNSRAPTFFNKSPTIPSAEILNNWISNWKTKNVNGLVAV